MTFDELYNLSVESSAISWIANTEPSQGVIDADTRASTRLSSAMRSFVLDSPTHPISVIHKPNSEELDLKYKLTVDKLWYHYLDLRKTKEPAGELYYQYFDELVAVTKELLVSQKVSHPIELNEHNFATPDTILSILEKMAKVCSVAIKNKIKNDIRMPKNATMDDIDSLVQAYRSDAFFKFSTENGSFMTNMDMDTARIHISKTDSLEDMHSSVTHELGHALYQTRFLNKNTEIGKLGGMLSLSLHESSSIFHELVLSGLDFLVDPDSPKNLKRLTADRLHYIIHIYIRTKVEHEIFENNLPAKEIPVLWNELMQEYIGIVPENEWDGFLQDVHWSSGAFGYFHSYAIGTLNAISMYNSVKDKLDGCESNDKVIIEEVILPEIEKRYGLFNEQSKEMLLSVHNNKSVDEIVGEFEDFVNKNFNVL